MELDFDIGQCFLCWHESKGAGENYDAGDEDEGGGGGDGEDGDAEGGGGGRKSHDAADGGDGGGDDGDDGDGAGGNGGNGGDGGGAGGGGGGDNGEDSWTLLIRELVPDTSTRSEDALSPPSAQLLCLCRVFWVWWT